VEVKKQKKTVRQRKYVMKSFIIYTLHIIFLGRLKQGK
jgi:hypothetical protein